MRFRFNKALVLCPHPDDFDVAAVTLRSFQRNGTQIHVVVAPTFSGILDSFFASPVSREVKITTREEEQRNSLLFFGLQPEQYEFLSHDCDLDDNGEFTYSESNAALVEACILNQGPDVILIPHPNDANPAHSAMYEMTRECLDRHALPVKLFKQMDPKTKDMRVDHYMSISDADAKWKSELLQHHKTQNHRNMETRGISLSERILQSNAIIAAKHQLPCKLAEAFEIETFPRTSN